MKLEASTNRRCALLLIDFINSMEFEGAERLAPRAAEAARRAAGLRRRASAEGLPVIYVNDSFGDWSGNFSGVVAKCERSKFGAPLVDLLRPTEDEAAILKPRHSAFYGTPLEFLLGEFCVDALLLAGLQTHICILFSAHDAYLRRYRLWIPSDCSASEESAQHQWALTHAKAVTGACIERYETHPSDRALAEVFAR